ncbi:hypothetical protein [Azospirillum canadense]|uniref:hypothetical protein n=1 Tax=Azospirillum canadense TaxID=403962 RepID=UPI0022279B1F|nr:hypothetical protein [Azospirillum canadense]MCW2242211.1 hypothetical protein [Azospirillum canadense]
MAEATLAQSRDAVQGGVARRAARDLPIIFSAPMVRALLDGRKTQTRRILKPQPETFLDEHGEALPIGLLHVEGDPRPRVTIGRVVTLQEVRYAVGDRLWVREAWANIAPGIYYRATDERAAPAGTKWRPSIHMPRWASRITLVVEGVRVQQLQDISPDDAQAEGVQKCHLNWSADGETFGGTPRDAFSALWDSINGPSAWDANPAIVALTFRVIRTNIDSLCTQEAA